MSRLRGALALVAVLATPACAAAPKTYAPQDPAAPLQLERQIALPGVKGRIDHLAIDLPHRLLFVADYGNGSVDVVDLAAGKVVDRIAGLREPQGLAVVGEQLVVACGDGSVHFYRARDRQALGQLALGDDADNVRIDPRNQHVIVGYGAGALAVIDAERRTVLSRTALPGHPEGFRLTGSTTLINVPDRGAILQADIDTGQVRATWSTGGHRLNFPLALAAGEGWFALAYRLPAAVQLRNLADGTVRATAAACGDADDLFVDRGRLLVICGSGAVDVLSAAHPEERERVTTAPGARTGLFVPELGRLFVAAPARAGVAAIWELRVRD